VSIFYLPIKQKGEILMKLYKINPCLILLGVLLTACTKDTTSSHTINNTHSKNPITSVISSPTPLITTATRQLDVPYVPTPEKIVDEMLQMAEVKDSDVLYDLGSGDGRILITAAKRFGTRGVGIDLNPQRIKESNENAQKTKVTEKVKFIEGDLFEQDFSEATVLTLYLLPEVNLKLRSKILQMKPGTRIVSHNYDMGDWAPEKTKVVETEDGTNHYIYFWRVP
jgi:16S rRNA G966 N2-methylase RsmD